MKLIWFYRSWYNQWFFKQEVGDTILRRDVFVMAELIFES